MMNKLSKLETILKSLSFLLGVATLFFGIIQYNQENERNFRKYLFEQQSSIYSEYLTVCTELSVLDKDSIFSKSFESTYHRFELLHFGKMSMVQDTSVLSAATDFYITVNLFKKNTSVVGKTDLQSSLDNLSKKCRKSLRNTWTKDFKYIY